MKCKLCGCNNTKENPVTKAPDLYQEEIYDDYIEVWECSNCREESIMDI